MRLLQALLALVLLAMFGIAGRFDYDDYCQHHNHCEEHYEPEMYEYEN